MSSRAETAGLVPGGAACLACCAPLIVGLAAVVPPVAIVGAAVAATGGGVAAFRRSRQPLSLVAVGRIALPEEVRLDDHHEDDE